MTRVAIVGLGLVGGSIALGLREARSGLHIVAVETSPPSADARRIADEVSDVSELARALRGAELAILAAPVGAIAGHVALALEHADVVTDCGSTKRAIAERAAASPRRARFVPGHPMAGGPDGGAQRARADLFRGKRWIVCPADSDAEATARVEALARDLGAELVSMTVEAHDAAVALTSHVPQLLASALLAHGTERGALAARGPAFDAATRAASANAAMWRDVFATNAAEIARALALLGGDLERVRLGLERDPPDVAPALELLARARRS